MNVTVKVAAALLFTGPSYSYGHTWLHVFHWVKVQAGSVDQDAGLSALLKTCIILKHMTVVGNKLVF